jgi:hypothetical protein
MSYGAPVVLRVKFIEAAVGEADADGGEDAGAEGA